MIIQQLGYLIIGVSITAAIPMGVIKIAMWAADKKDKNSNYGKSSIQNKSNNGV